MSVSALEIDLKAMDLEALSALANSEAAKVGEAFDDAAEAMSRGLVHAIRSGEAMAEAQERLGAREWKSWAKENLDVDPRTGIKYMRFAHYKDHLMGADERLTTLTAEVYLRGLPPARDMHRKIRKPPEVVDEVKRLGSQNMTVTEIATLVGVSHAFVKATLDPAWAKRRVEQKRRTGAKLRAAKAALAEKEKRAERDALARRAGGATSEAYALIRKAALAIDRALVESSDPEEREALRKALGFTHKAEDSLVVALRTERAAAA